MKPLIDASSIYEAARTDKAKELEGLYTVEIARYEIGNTLWKHTSLLGTYSPEESADMIRLFTDIFHVMRFLQLKGHERGVLELANELGAPYYDASYIYFALRRGMPLVTDDGQMAKRSGLVGLDCYPVKDL